MTIKERRHELHNKLKEVFGSNNIYFQPPENVRLKYPCIVYTRGSINDVPADNRDYTRRVRYTLTLIGEDPDSDMVDKLLEQLPYCSYDRYFVADNLSHDVFTLFY